MSARILVVDDLEPNVKLLTDRLTGEYYNVISANCGPDAIELARTQKPDLVLLDVMMPGMDGFEVCRRLKGDALTRHIPVVMVTALSETQDRVQGLDAGADDFLTKPVNDTQLQARIRSLIRLKMVTDEWRMRQATAKGLGVDADSGEQGEDARGAEVLVVDDNRATPVVISRALAPDGHRVAAAADPAAIEARAAAGGCELVVINLFHRKLDALRVCATLRAEELTRHLPILVLTQDGHQDRLAKAFDLGINDYITQPFDSNEVRARVRTQVRRKRYQDRMRDNIERGLSLAITDGLTGLNNRRYADRHLETLAERFGEEGRPFAVAMVDVDHFKKINDTYGHAAGDDVLRALAQRLLGGVRSFDSVARWGGEEFLVILQDVSPEVAAAIGERLRSRVGRSPIALSGQAAEVPVTISVGIALMQPEYKDARQLIEAADKALYRAKSNGRDRVEIVGAVAVAA
jgi:two-component system, cell cycle response regulator